MLNLGAGDSSRDFGDEITDEELEQIFNPSSVAELKVDQPIDLGSGFGLADDGNGGLVATAPADKKYYEEFLTKFRDGGKASRFRYDSLIGYYLGANGSGKTQCMVLDTWNAVLENKLIYSNIRYVDPHTGNELPMYRPLFDWQQALNVSQKDFVLGIDEVQGAAGASDNLPADLRNAMHQFRRRGIRFFATGISFAVLNKRLREVTRLVTVCHGFFPKEDEKTGWPQNRVFSYKSFDAVDYNNFEVTDLAELMRKAKQKPAARAKKSQLLLRPGIKMISKPLITHGIYDTLAPVIRINDGMDSGRCSLCQGTKPNIKCSCTPEQKAKAINEISTRKLEPWIYYAEGKHLDAVGHNDHHKH